MHEGCRVRLASKHSRIINDVQRVFSMEKVYTFFGSSHFKAKEILELVKNLDFESFLRKSFMFPISARESPKRIAVKECLVFLMNKELSCLEWTKLIEMKEINSL